VKSEGCTEVQGYLFSPPRPASQVKTLIAEINHSAAISTQSRLAFG